jgi:8-oxo-dGTP pyrophosphatase MutT (NUDIX family)
VTDPLPALRHERLQHLADVLRERPGALANADGDPARAAVAIVLRVAIAEPELLLIVRAEREGDPWSGQVALPGGRWSADDATLQDTALRETLEETAVDVDRDGVVLGTLDELRPDTPMLPSIIVTPFVCVVRPDVDIAVSDELSMAFWVPMDSVIDPVHRTESDVTARGRTWRVPAFVVGRHVVWGMTERILANLHEVLRTG